MPLPVDRASMVAELRANKNRILADKTKTLQLPGWDSLSVRYKRLPFGALESLSGALDSDDETAKVGAAMDVLLKACEEVLYQGEGLGLRYEQGLAQLIGDDESVSPPEVIDSVFPDELSLILHAADYMSWCFRMENEAAAALGKG
jgi:hypothetical protein